MWDPHAVKTKASSRKLQRKFKDCTHKEKVMLIDYKVSATYKPRMIGMLRRRKMNSKPKMKHDVFISFRSKDTRDNFVSHLCGCLRRKRIKTFLYDELPSEERYEESLKAIQVSRVSVIVFSENFGDSKWCLDEVVAILKCKEKFGQIVIPVLYHVDPLDIENQTGSFGDAFAKRQDKAEQIQEWRDGFAEAINLPSWSTTFLRDEEKLVNEIAHDIEIKLLRASRTKISYTKEELREFCGNGLGPFLGFTIQLRDQNRFGSFPEMIGLVCALCQTILTAVNYSFINHKDDSPIKFSVWPIMFALGLLFTMFLKKYYY